MYNIILTNYNWALPVVVLYVFGDCEKWFELITVPGK